MTTETNYSLSELEAKALDFIRRNKKKACKGMSKAEIQEWAKGKAVAAKDYAETLMETGLPDFVAWDRAIRMEILESDSD